MMSQCLQKTYCIVKTLPLIFILLIIGWSYYAYVVAMCIYSIPATNIAEKVLLIAFYHGFFVLFIWSYMQTTIARPVCPPDEYILSSTDWAHVQSCSDTTHEVDPQGSERRREFLVARIAERGLPVRTRGLDGSVRICEICRLIKPDRAHHCATCDVCMLKMDHHCPWVNNCVGLHNYKYFILFLLYGSLYCFYVGGSSAKYFVSFWTEGVSDVQAYRFHVLFLFFAAWMFSISLLALGGYHLHLTLHNQTTLESFRAPVLVGGSGLPDKRAYHVGAGRNFRQVFGDRPALWFLPLPTWQLDGLNWQLRVTVSPRHLGYATMEDGSGNSPVRRAASAAAVQPSASTLASATGSTTAPAQLATASSGGDHRGHQQHQRSASTMRQPLLPEAAEPATADVVAAAWVESESQPGRRQ